MHSSMDKFDRASGSRFERLLFNNRIIFLLCCLVVTMFLGLKALDVRVNADFNDTIPTHQPFIVNYLNHYNELQAQANAIQVSVTANNGTIIDQHYLAVLAKINDRVFLLPGVDEAFMTSLWTPNTRWYAVTPDGIDGGPVISSGYDGSQQQLEVVRQNILKTGRVGSLVSADFKSSMIYVPLLEKNGLTGKPLNYGDLARQLNSIRNEYASQGVTLRILGFAMIVGDMINGIDKVLTFFALSILIATTFLYWYTRCVRSTLLVVFASLTAVIWQMGFLSLLGFDLTPYSVLVPFLVFAIGNEPWRTENEWCYPGYWPRYPSADRGPLYIPQTVPGWVCGFDMRHDQFRRFDDYKNNRHPAACVDRQYRRRHLDHYQSYDAADHAQLYRRQQNSGFAID